MFTRRAPTTETAPAPTLAALIRPPAARGSRNRRTGTTAAGCSARPAATSARGGGLLPAPARRALPLGLGGKPPPPPEADAQPFGIGRGVVPGHADHGLIRIGEREVGPPGRRLSCRRLEKRAVLGPGHRGPG